MQFTKSTTQLGNQQMNQSSLKNVSILVGICGGSGSGKTTILRRLNQEFAALNPAVISLDNYYLPIEKQQKDAEGKENFDLPTALNSDKLLKDIERLLSGKKVIQKEYHFNYQNKTSYITIQPSSLIFVEGLFVLHYEKLRSLLDFSIFIEVDAEIQFDRRVQRDQRARGYSYEQILYQWENHVLPCYENYLLPYRNTSSIVVQNNLDINDAVKELIHSIHIMVEKND